MSDLHIELNAFQYGTKSRGGDEDNRPYHFKRIVGHYWGKGSKKPFVWNPWNTKMLEACCTHNRCALVGSASSSKTYFMAVWGVVNWLCDPLNTLVLFTSTSLEDSRRRIWGDVEGFIMAAQDEKAGKVVPARILSSVGKVRTRDGGITYPDKCGLQLIPGDRAKEKENIGKIIGAKNKRVFLMGDEFPELSPALTEAAEGNLMSNPHFQMVVSGNFKGLYDPFGQFVEPIGGWGSVTPEHDEWPIKGGVALHFDGRRSPNVLEGFDKYPGLYGMTQLENHKKLGEHTATFWRMCVSFPCSEGEAGKIYSDADLLKGDVKNNVVRWKDTPIEWAALDPAFATGGDKAMSYYGKFGMTIENKQVMLVTERKELREDIRKKDENKSVQVAKKFRDECLRRGVKPEHAAYDISGGGVVFGGLLSEIWPDNHGSKLLGVQFGGAPSERRVSRADNRPACDVYQNRVGELWYAGLDYFHSGQIKGVPLDACVELTERRVRDLEKRAQGLKVKIETKQEMKSRTGGKSPDDADCLLLGLELLRQRCNFQPVGMEGKRALVNMDGKRRLRAVERLYRNATHEHQYSDAEAA